MHFFAAPTGATEPVSPSYLCNVASVVQVGASSTVSLRSGPSDKSPKLGKLMVGAVVYVCDERWDWYQVFFSEANEPCGKVIAAGLDVRLVSKCKSGWINRRWIDVRSG